MNIQSTTLRDVSETNEMNGVAGFDLVMTAILALVLMLLIFFGNALTILAYLKDRSLRTVPFNVFIINLAVADMLVGVITVPIYTTYVLLLNVFSFDLPIIVQCSLSICSTVPIILSVCCILLMTIDRLRMVKDPIKYKLMASNKANVKHVVLASLTGVVYISLPLSMAYIHGLNYNSTSLDEILFHHTILPFFNFYAPCAALVITNALFIIHLRRQLSELRAGKLFKSMQLDKSIAEREQVHFENISRSISTVHVFDSKVSISTNRSDERHISKKLRKAAFNLFVLVAAYIICWCPVNVIITLTALFSLEVSQTVNGVAVFLFLFNSAINPVIYALINPKFRNAMIQVMSSATVCGRNRK